MVQKNWVDIVLMGPLIFIKLPTLKQQQPQILLIKNPLVAVDTQREPSFLPIPNNGLILPQMFYLMWAICKRRSDFRRSFLARRVQRQKCWGTCWCCSAPAVRVCGQNAFSGGPSLPLWVFAASITAEISLFLSLLLISQLAGPPLSGSEQSVNPAGEPPQNRSGYLWLTASPWQIIWLKLLSSPGSPRVR